MSHYAQIVAPLIVNGPGRATATLEVGTEIKNVTILGDGQFGFDARIEGAWIPLLTDEDLPAFTDKGRAHRARKVHATLRPGRPLAGDEQVTKPIAFRPTPVQREWLQKHADKHGVSLSELVRRGMSKLGMPR